MTHELNIRKALVVLSPDLVRPDAPMESALIRRAISLARITGCELELFQVCYDSRLDYGLFTSARELRSERERLADKDATLLSELAARLKDESVNVRYEARWDYPRTDAILRKVAQAKPDIVMKQAREQSYILGLTSNADWELVRRSPAHVWLVSDEVEDIKRVLAAIGNNHGDPADVTTAADYDLLETSRQVGDTFKAAIYSVNAIQMPHPPLLGAGTAEAAIASSIEPQLKLQQEIREQHEIAVRAIANYFNIPGGNVHICEGHPNKVIPQAAGAVGADLIVMGARSIGRLERFMKSVTVEPVIAETDCDILIVRDGDSSNVIDGAASPFYGVPRHDLESAIIDPQDAFESPWEVVNLSDTSIDLRKRILQAWEYDIRAEMEAENEGGFVKEIDVNALDEILSAKELLDAKQNGSRKESTRLSGATA
jgi:universal stress protein E